MSYWVLVVAPLVLASFVMLFAFVGCGLNPEGEEHGEPRPPTYRGVVTSNEFCVSYWRLGEDTGETTAVDSQGDNDGTYMGDVILEQPGLVVGDSDTAAQFDGSTAYVSVPHDASLNPAKFTVEALVDVAGGEGQVRVVVSSRDLGADTQTFGYLLNATDQNKWEARVGDGATPEGGFVTGPDVTPGKHYLAMTYDGKTLKLYVDPAEDTPVTAEVLYAQNTAKELRIGAGGGATEPGTPQAFFNGVIDEVAVYNVDLDFSVIQTHFTLATTGAAPE